MSKNLILKLFLILIISCSKSKGEVPYKWKYIEFSDKLKIKVEIVKTEEERALGLMFRHSLKEDHGMFFVFEREDYQSFWMKNCFFPIDIIFIDKNGKIVDIKENFQPCQVDPCPSYKSKEKAKYVLEVNAGFSKKNNIKIGQSLKLPSVD